MRIWETWDNLSQSKVNNLTQISSEQGMKKVFHSKNKANICELLSAKVAEVQQSEAEQQNITESPKVFVIDGIIINTQETNYPSGEIDKEELAQKEVEDKNRKMGGR